MIENDLIIIFACSFRSMYIYILYTGFDRPKSFPCYPYSLVVVIYEIIDYCAGASSAGDNAISLHGTSTPWHRSSRSEFTDPSLSLSFSLYPLLHSRAAPHLEEDTPSSSTLRHPFFSPTTPRAFNCPSADGRLFSSSLFHVTDVLPLSLRPPTLFIRV